MQSRHVSSISSLLKEPLVHFVGLATIVFIGYQAVQSEDEFIIEITQSEIDARISLLESSKGTTASPALREEITELYLEEQMLVREALTLNLDNDARIHDMLAQKMRHVISGEIIQPNEDEIQAFYDENIDSYQTPRAIVAEEIIFETQEELSDPVKQLLIDGADPDTLLAAGKGSVNTLPRVNSSQLSNLFNVEFSDRVFNAKEREWIGPLESELGQHWLRVIRTEASRTPSLEEIRNRVRLEWINQEEETRLQREVDQLWEKYSVKILGGRTEH